MIGKILKLKKPIMINGEEKKEISYDLEAVTAQDKINASKNFKKAGNAMSFQETDPDYHLYLFAEAAKKCDGSIDISDILRLSAKDSVKAEEAVRNYFFFDLEDMSQIDISEGQ